MIDFLPEEFSFKFRCKDCGYDIFVGKNDDLTTITSITDHIECSGHTKYDLEIYDLDLRFTKEMTDIVGSFYEIDDTLTLVDLITKLKIIGYKDVGPMIRGAIQKNILYVDDIEDVVVYLGLTESGEKIWELINKVERIE